MVLVTAAVEHDSGDACLLRPLSQQLADLACLRRLVALGPGDALVERRGLSERVADGVVDDLREHMPRGPVNDQPRPGRAAGDPLAYPQVPPDKPGRGLLRARTHASSEACE